MRRRRYFRSLQEEESFREEEKPEKDPVVIDSTRRIEKVVIYVSE
jgi:hypothetical protein